MEKRLTTALLTLIPSLAVGADWTADEIEARIKSCPARDANTYYILLSCVHGRYTSLPDSDQYKDRLGERTAQLQKLLEEGSILRKNDLEKFLALRADLVSHAAKTNESVAILTRRLIVFPGEGNLRLTCPKCKKAFLAPDCNALLLSIVKNVDLTPDFSSICPHCSTAGTNQPNEEKECTLHITVRRNGKEIKSKLNHEDLHLLYAFLSSNEMYRQKYNRQGQEELPHLTPEQAARLREILLGEKAAAKK